MYITEVVGNSLFTGHFLENFKHCRHPARTGRTGYKHVVTLFPDAQSEAECLKGAVLADNLFEWF
ncbi:MAG: hypothetical protein A4E66_02337 [Syntrophus sp. PtaB.Bin001]|nr:MAG: hypothetical protein A4E66_02337 [Syntrophus sp. PtaB.Bin001]